MQYDLPSFFNSNLLGFSVVQVAYSGSVHGGSHMKSLPRPGIHTLEQLMVFFSGGKVTYDATMSSLPPLLPGFKENKERKEPAGKGFLCCCVIL